MDIFNKFTDWLETVKEKIKDILLNIRTALKDKKTKMVLVSALVLGTISLDLLVLVLVCLTLSGYVEWPLKI